MFQKKITALVLFSLLISATACQRNIFQSPTVAPATLRDVPALRLNFRFESDVPAPAAVGASANQNQANDERVQSVQNDFDTNRPQEVLDKTIVSPDKNRVLAVYHKSEDMQAEFRLDMYAPDGKLLRKITPNGMAVHFPDTIIWSPDSNNVAFVGMIRVGGGGSGGNQQPGAMPSPGAETSPTPSPAPDDPNAPTNGNTNTDANAGGANPAESPTPAAPAAATPEPPASVLTFRTEQLYLCNTDGGELKPITQNEGLIYFYFAWAPDSSALVTLAATIREWQFGQMQAEQKAEIFVPTGRPRLVEKSGRIRLLDDNLTRVQPVWSPDSGKVAVAFDKDVRIYDAIGDAPTQAAIPLRNQLLISSQKYDNDLRAKEQQGANTNANANANTNANAAAPLPNTNANTTADVGTLPDENTLVSFNPITELNWTAPEMLYLQTGYIREMKNPSDSARSYLRWHRLIFSPQAVAL